ncbi:hypothetical protein C8J56DRAFT_939179 [Mycena floridula]|nr:hypothetical protein C8J56DRAFT_939179 [Mycena floridula]
MTDVVKSYAALLIGGLTAFGLSGIVAVQAVVYYKLYPEDYLPKKLMVAGVWGLDMLHSAFICVSLIDYFVTFFGDRTRIDHIPWSIAFSVVITAIQTLIAHCFFARKIFKSSDKNWFITAPILVLAVSRLLAASVSTVEMKLLHRYSAFNEHFPGWIFTTGLSLSAGVDIIITGCLFYFLRKFRRRLTASESMMIHVVDTLTLYTVENGLLTCMTTTASLICWLTMPTNLVFLGLHFVIGKLYANSLLASLNTRKELRDMRSHMQPWPRDPNYPILTGDDFPRYPDQQYSGSSFSYYSGPPRNPKVEVSVFQTVTRRSDEFDELRAYRNQRHPMRRAPTLLQYSPRLP